MKGNRVTVTIQGGSRKNAQRVKPKRRKSIM
jgi:hypothetical protein